MIDSVISVPIDIEQVERAITTDGFLIVRDRDTRHAVYAKWLESLYITVGPDESYEDARLNTVTEIWKRDAIPLNGVWYPVFTEGQADG